MTWRVSDGHHGRAAASPPAPRSGSGHPVEVSASREREGAEILGTSPCHLCLSSAMRFYFLDWGGGGGGGGGHGSRSRIMARRTRRHGSLAFFSRISVQRSLPGKHTPNTRTHIPPEILLPASCLYVRCFQTHLRSASPEWGHRSQPSARWTGAPFSMYRSGLCGEAATIATTSGP